MGAVRGAFLAAAVALASVVATPVTASAGIWHAYPPGAERTCSATQVYLGTAYQVCLEFNEVRSQVRTIAFINPGAYTNFQVNIRLRFGGGGPDITDSCPTMTSNGSRACYTAFTDLRRPYAVAEATFGIAGRWMPTVRALDMRMINKQQAYNNYCGPAAAQIVLSTIGVVAPDQYELATRMNTHQFGTLPGGIPDALNAYLPAGGWMYHDHYSPSGHGTVAAEIVTSLGRGRPVMILVKPSELPWVGGGSDLYRHYLVVHGYGGEVRGDGSFAVDTFKVADPGSKTEHPIGVETLLDNADNAWTFSDIARIRT